MIIEDTKKSCEKLDIEKTHDIIHKIQHKELQITPEEAKAFDDKQELVQKLCQSHIDILE